MEEEREKREHRAEMKRLQLRILEENSKTKMSAAEAAEKRQQRAMEVERSKTAEVNARKRYASEMAAKKKESEERAKKSHAQQSFDNLQAACANAAMLFGSVGGSMGMGEMNGTGGWYTAT